MWQKYSEQAGEATYYALAEAHARRSNSVSPEHLLLGLIHVEGSVAVGILDRLGVSTGRIRAELEPQIIPGTDAIAQEAQLTPDAKRVIDRAYHEAITEDALQIGSEHILLGLLGEDGIACRVLTKLGADIDGIRRVRQPDRA
ncbi:MAG: Clp protease N-terminal domain-containing protein [Chthonomonadales bacterium]